MNVYLYDGELLCEDCGEETMRDLVPGENSDDYPQGPYADGGGEADRPQHCAQCRAFLENPLTLDGMDYVREAVNMHTGTFYQTWADFYGIERE